MPRGDRTGPNGMGPMTGRAAGFCSGYDRPGYMNAAGGRGNFGRGYGRGFGPGQGLGYGRGLGRGRGFGRDLHLPILLHMLLIPHLLKQKTRAIILRTN